MTSNFNADDAIRAAALGVAIEPEPRAATDRQKYVATLEENAHLHDRLSAANRDRDTARAERNFLLWCCVVQFLNICWLAGRVLALGAGQ